MCAASVSDAFAFFDPFFAQLSGHTGAVTALLALPTLGLLASGSKDHSVRLWDVQTGACVREMAGEHRRAVQALVLARGPGDPVDSFVSGANCSKLLMWSGRDGSQLRVIDRLEEENLHGMIALGGTRVVTASNSANLRVCVGPRRANAPGCC